MLPSTIHTLKFARRAGVIWVESWCRGYEAVGSLVCGLVKGKQPFQYVPHCSALRMLRHAMHMYFDQYDLQMDISNKIRPTFSIFTGVSCRRVSRRR